MLAEDFVYPPYDIPLVDAYDSAFEAVFIVLHPFIRVPHHLAWTVTHRYPHDSEILSLGTPVCWTEVAAQIGLTNCAQVNRALLTSIGSLDPHLADFHGRNALQRYLQAEPVWMPVEGQFPILLRPEILRIFSAAQWKELIFVPEFPRTDPPQSLELNQLRSGVLPFPRCGTLLAPDGSFLFTVDWDSFFTLFYGERVFIEETARTLHLEGFFATPNTEHAWFNYSMGCATVTLSPEHWQTA